MIVAIAVKGVFMVFMVSESIVASGRSTAAVAASLVTLFSLLCSLEVLWKSLDELFTC